MEIDWGVLLKINSQRILRPVVANMRTSDKVILEVERPRASTLQASSFFSHH